MIFILDNCILDLVSKTANWIAYSVTDFLNSFFDRTCIIHEVHLSECLFCLMGFSKHLFSEFFASIDRNFIKLIDECNLLEGTKLLIVA